jgi:hypothetical protein
MVDDERAQRINEAARKFAEALSESYRAASGRFVEAQERQTRDATSFFERVIANLRAGAESGRDASGELAEQARKGQEAGWVLARESVGAYMDFLNSMFSQYSRGVETARRSAEEAEVSTGEAEESSREDIRELIRETNRRSRGEA